ncbi:MAG: transglutaminase-like cysteine peptidase [Rhodobacteraceae bacterium]|jgi:predicted transglutaminase-like cysteine proteinase|uniref:transglutaminase-like cysteine peptidase n=1 Tax=Albidovulum sp. TaxID=1872424 RepID=UPI001DEEE148|nr:transglutaminase-like cysteine peptidase [uncultured Defluviimonas sp.]MCB2126481.1 transglutaminase-like cysteine peptidase [Paracoccaceae bacterium]MCC0068706.1 transglutaminase-like cysteine peptidase [Paracoccaceae bacterium]
MPVATDHPRTLTRLAGVTRRTLFALAFAATGVQAAPAPLPAHLEPIRAAPAPSGSGDLCNRLRWACATSLGRTEAPESALALARSVNQAVNASVHEVPDRSQYGRDDLWDLPTARGGDCEDFALAKKKRLIEAGVPAGALLIATVLDRHRNHHAVLVLRTAAQDVVLDNLTDRMLPWHRTGYSFLRMQEPNDPRRWNAIAAGGIFDAADRATGG